MAEKSSTLPQFKPDGFTSETTPILTPPPEDQKKPFAAETYATNPDDALQDLKIYFESAFSRALLRTETSLSDSLDFFQAHPMIATFFLAQIACSCIPVGLFVLGAVISALVAVALFSCVALLLLVPVLVGTSILGGCLWGWGWVVVVGGRWVLGLVRDGDGDADGVESLDGNANEDANANGNGNGESH
ncbi:hypothetical protein BDV28DRAFT_159185 [Aspergillus coremiiformis]|uniref:Uncharacterized protein n=1 Tax=Aspergillus coremiiformis TaxID=138285 RepID=A0A5N6YZW7_9EURO|nr:hypothetical protein BDV28DRAFT_159185 [Aspergillus coremiiformis]